MKQLIAFIQKEFVEAVRTGKLLVLTILFILFGVMNPAVAKMTPWLMEMMSESLAEAGMTVTEVIVDAQTSWMQFYKNLPIALIIFGLMFSGILVNEYQKGTLINMITKGLIRWKIIVSKLIVMLVFWTLGYWTCYLITFGYSAYFWDNSVSSHLVFAAACFYLIGIWLISLILLMSVFSRTSASVILGAGGVFLAVYLLGMFPAVKEYLPAQLMAAPELLVRVGNVSGYGWSIIVTCAWVVANVAVAIVCFNRRDF